MIRSSPLSQQEQPKLERKLQAVYQPVEARPAFVGDLRKRLGEAERGAPISLGEYAIWGGIGVLSSVLIVIMGIRASRTFMDTLGLLKHMRHPMPKEEANTQPASSGI